MCAAEWAHLGFVLIVLLLGLRIRVALLETHADAVRHEEQEKLRGDEARASECLGCGRAPNFFASELRCGVVFVEEI